MSSSRASRAYWLTIAVVLCWSVSPVSAAEPKKLVPKTAPKPPTNSSPARKPAEAGALRYGWRGGATYTYQVQFEIDLVERIKVLTCSCFYVVRPTSKDQIVFHGSQAGKGTGTAFVVAANGYLLTCAHVVENAEKIDVALGGKNYEAKVVAVDEANDIALLRIEAQGLRFLPLFESENVEVGQDIRVMGFPMSSELGENIKVTRGIVTGINLKQDVKRFQVDAAVNPGNSGGPMVNEKGEVVAIADSKLAGVLVSNVAFGVPSNYARKLLDQKKVTYSVGTSAAKAEGPELVKRVSPAVALVTVTARQARLLDDGEHFSLTLNSRIVQSNRAKPGYAPIAPPVSPYTKRPSQRSGSTGVRRSPSRIYGSPSISLTAVTREEKNLQMDELGCVLDAQGAGLSSLMFGNLPMIEPLPPDGKRTWEVKREQVAIDELGWGRCFAPGKTAASPPRMPCWARSASFIRSVKRPATSSPSKRNLSSRARKKRRASPSSASPARVPRSSTPGLALRARWNLRARWSSTTTA
jgi:S1-C subfamily serine protease